MDYTQTWPKCPEAARHFDALFCEFIGANPEIARLAEHFRDQAGVDLRNLIDHWQIPRSADLINTMASAGLRDGHTSDGDWFWYAPAVRLPRIRMSADARGRHAMVVAVDDVATFVEANGFEPDCTEGDPESGFEFASISLSQDRLIVAARRGYDGFRPMPTTESDRQDIADLRRDLATRERPACERDAIRVVGAIMCRYAPTLGMPRCVDEFFAAERRYYSARNRAAAWIYTRQLALGFGWANHDHHTYRSSRSGFRDLTRLWLSMGFTAREKFYAGADAGWGAQVLEHPVSRVVIFADVDMAPSELDWNFSEQVLPTRDDLGTIGLWCALHTDSIASAGMHHIECEFDFLAASVVFEAAGHRVMKPFTDLDVLKQRFTEPEMWPVSPERVRGLLKDKAITAEQASIFTTLGAAGSHVEILQRWDGFKGFNKTGVSAIIRETDARLAAGRVRGVE